MTLFRLGIVFGLLALNACTQDNGLDLLVDPTTPLTCGAPATPIHLIQGEVALSPMIGKLVEVEAVVSARFLKSLGGIYLATPAGLDDRKPSTSEGLFVRLTDPPDSLPRFVPVRVRGRVAEIGDAPDTQTALVEVSGLLVCGDPVGFGPTVYAGVPATASDWEAMEGMRIKIKGPATLIDNDRLVSHGELTVSLDGRDFAATERRAPGPEARAIAEANAYTRLQIDDAREQEFPDRLWFLREQVSVEAPYRLDSALFGIDGVLDQVGEHYRLRLAEPIDRVDQAPRPTEPPLLDGDLIIASFNVLNLFNGDGLGGEFPTARGARNAADYRRQLGKTLAALAAMRADIVVLTEVENDGEGETSALAELTRELNRKLGKELGDYDFVRTGLPQDGGDKVKVAMIFRTSRVAVLGKPALLDAEPFTKWARLPLAQAFSAQGRQFVLVGNHFKSKGSCDLAEGPNQNQDDGQACFNAMRTEMARKLDEWLKSDTFAKWPPARLVVGDLNAYGEEDPIRLLRAQGWLDVHTEFNSEPGYSFVFDGAAGRLDHGLANAEFAALIGDAGVWHINADESDAMQYEQAGHDANARKRRYRADPFASSDHDPLLIALKAEPQNP